MTSQAKRNVSDDVLVAEIKAYMTSHQHVSRTALRLALNTSLMRIEKLEKAGLITAPKVLTKSIGATMSRKRSNKMAGWYINRPAAWQTKGAKHE